VSESKGPPDQISNGIRKSPLPPKVLTRAPNTPVVSDDETLIRPFSIVAIGASAGGIEAVQGLLKKLPPDTGMAYVLIQHLDPHYESKLTAIHSKMTRMRVLEAEDRMRVEPNHLYVIPPNTCMCIKGGILNLEPRPEGQHLNLPIDLFFTSLAHDWGSQSIAVVLSGTASDGSRGIMAVKDVGGITFAQDESAQYDSMPKNAVLTECVDFVLSLPAIAQKLSEIAPHPYVTPSKSAVDNLLLEEESFKKISAILFKTSGVNFSLYKQGTVQRRIMRRMALSKVQTLREYLAILENDAKELEKLRQDILIHVTRFFRDAEMFEALKKEIFPALTKNKFTNEHPLRMWVAGCSTGEEVYSIAISLLEFLGGEANSVPFHIFGTDLNESCVYTARRGVYSPLITADVSEERLRRFFLKTTEGKYQIIKSIREQCVFSVHNVAADPPFSRMDLISCRNLLIYLGPELQQKVFPLFHYALNPGGFLVLGQSESVVAHDDLFAVINKSAKLFTKKPANTPQVSLALQSSLSGREPLKIPTTISNRSESRTNAEVLKEADHLILSKYDHAGVVVNANMEILQFRGDTSSYLRNTPGTPSFNLLKMVREGLAAELRLAIDKAKQDKRPFKKTGLRMKYKTEFKSVFIEVNPLNTSPIDEVHFLILFGEDEPLQASKTNPEAAPPKKGDRPTPSRLDGLEGERDSIKEELSSTKIFMQSIIEEREGANEELQTANEEILSSNEELQSLNEELYSSNEELQTAKEELQASNEETTTINDELQHRNELLVQLSDDLENVLTSISLPVVIVGGRPTRPALHAQSRKNIPPSSRRHRPVDHGHQATATHFPSRNPRSGRHQKPLVQRNGSSRQRGFLARSPNTPLPHER